MSLGESGFGTVYTGLHLSDVYLFMFLGKGGFGTVYTGLRLSDGKLVAIKHVAKSKISSWETVRKVTY